MTGERGFTIIEVMVAVMILTVGLLALVGTAGLVTRMIGQGQRYTEVATLANERVEILRAEGCPALGAGSETRAGYTINWLVTDAGGLASRGIEVVVTSSTGTGSRVDTVQTVQVCP
jgi:prepilin-type N-terminal cleavage/methylation domain-containing protein